MENIFSFFVYIWIRRRKKRRRKRIKSSSVSKMVMNFMIFMCQDTARCCLLYYQNFVNSPISVVVGKQQWHWHMSTWLSEN